MAEANVALTQDPDNVEALCIRGLGLAIKNDVRTLDDLNRAIALDPRARISLQRIRPPGPHSHRDGQTGPCRRRHAKSRAAGTKISGGPTMRE